MLHPAAEETIATGKGDALVVVDVQRDFLAGGALAVPDGGSVIAPLNRYIARFAAEGLPIFATRDWHPRNHCSFKVHSGTWPVHCVAESEGAEFSPALELPPRVHIISKATAAGQEAYSGFDAELDARLKQFHIRRLFVGGLATEYCVLATVRDALELGYEVLLLTDAIRGINLQPDDCRRAEQEMTKRGAKPVRWEGAKIVASARDESRR